MDKHFVMLEETVKFLLLIMVWAAFIGEVFWRDKLSLGLFISIFIIAIGLFLFSLIILAEQKIKINHFAIALFWTIVIIAGTFIVDAPHFPKWMMMFGIIICLWTIERMINIAKDFFLPFEELSIIKLD